MSSVVIRSLTGVIVITTSLQISLLSAAETIDPVVVTATRTAETADSTLSPMIIIDAETIEKNAGADIADILRQYSGIEIGRYGGPDQLVSIFMRGTNSAHTLVLIDGVKINSGTAGIAAIQNIELNIIDHIEVVKGPRSTLYGSDAIGGVINIITKRSSKPGTNYSATIGAGSYDTRTLKFEAAKLTNENSASMQLSGIESKGFPTLTTSSSDNGYNRLSVNMNGHKKIPIGDAEITYWHTNGNTQYLDEYTLAPLDQNFVNDSATLSIKSPITAYWLSTLKLSFTQDEINQNQPDIYATPPVNDFAHTQRYSLDWQHDFSPENNLLITSGIYLSNEHTQAMSYGTYFDENTPVNAFFLQGKKELNNHKLVVGGRYTDHSAFGSYSTWNVEYGYLFNKDFRLIAASNSGFHAPTTNDRFAGGGNPNLKAETSVNNELGLRYHIGTSHKIELNVFDNKIDNLIAYNNATSQVENIQQAEIKGTEAIYSLQISNWSFGASATIQTPRNLTTDAQLARRSEHIYNFYYNYSFANSNIGVNLTYTGNRPDGSQILDNYTLVNLTGKYKFGNTTTINARIENLTNENYQTVYGYRTPGRSGYVEAQYHFN